MVKNSGLYLEYNPPSPLNGGIPLSTEIPAPVKTQICSEDLNKSIAFERGD